MIIAEVSAAGPWFTILVIAGFVVCLVSIWNTWRRSRKLIRRLNRRCDELIQDGKALRAQVVALRCRAEGVTARLPLVFRAKQGEDLVAFELFNEPGAALKTIGLAIECGAHDGVTGSVTYLLDALGWDCVLVEPLPHLAEKCRASRPHARVVHTALSKRGSSGTADIELVARNSGRSYLSGGDHGARSSTKTSTKVTVPLTTMDAVLEGESRRVDLLVLDVEGAEVSVLEGMDLEKHRPRVMIIEDHNLGEGGLLLAYLTARGYTHAGWVWRNRVFVRSDDAAMLARAAALQQQFMGLRATPG
ncbi:MAG: FkbM family methyltransferase, partial [Phycisphaerales bacterium]